MKEKKGKKQIQVKCMIKCEECGQERGIIIFALEHNREVFPEYSYSEFYSFAESNYNDFEELVKEKCYFDCDECGDIMRITEIFDMKYV